MNAHSMSWGEVEAWLKARRDACGRAGAEKVAFWVLDDALDDLREHMRTGTPLNQPVRRTTEDQENER